MVAWLTGLGLSLPILASDVNTVPCYLMMEAVPWLVGYLPGVCFILPLVIIAVVYTIIFYTMRNKLRGRTMTGEVRRTVEVESEGNKEDQKWPFLND